MRKETHQEVINEVNDEEFLTNNWLTSEVLVGMYSRIFTNSLLLDDMIFKNRRKQVERTLLRKSGERF